MTRPTALISGVGRRVGIGAAIARKLAAEGWNLALTYWTPYDDRMPWGAQPDDIAILKDEVHSLGARVTCISKDLEHPEAACDIFKAAREALGPISALVLAHCESVNSGVLDTRIESFDRHFAVNTRASWQLVKELAAQVPETGGRIVALTSDATIGNLPYGASKGALDRIILAAARELAHLHILSNVVNPGPIDTGWMDKETRLSLIEQQPTGRLGKPEDTPRRLSFLLSPAGAWINGQLINSDGGLSA